jgi:hypothetical protein
MLALYVIDSFQQATGAANDLLQYALTASICKAQDADGQPVEGSCAYSSACNHAGTV